MGQQRNKEVYGLGLKCGDIGVCEECRLCMTNDEVLSGTLESHELNSGKTPLLISLCAQATLGLVKDMGAGTVSIKGHGELRIHRCSRTGLMMINLSEFQRYQQARKLPKSVRALRAEVIFPPAAMAGRKDDPDCVQRLHSRTWYVILAPWCSLGLRWDRRDDEDGERSECGHGNLAGESQRLADGDGWLQGHS